MWLEEVRGRERGELRARRFEASARARRAASLALSNRKEFATPHHGAVNSLQVPLLLPLLPLPQLGSLPQRKLIYLLFSSRSTSIYVKDRITASLLCNV